MKTNFSTLSATQLQAWSRDFWRVARNNSFINQFAGTGSNAMVQRITELTKTQKGTKANLTLLADMTGDGVTGDHDLEGNEERLRAYDISIQLDQLRFANRLAGRLTDQKTVVNFREQSRDALAYAMADRIDQMAFLTLSGISYAYKNNGADRPVLATGQNLSALEFASDVTSPSANRHFRWDYSGTDGATSSLVASGSGDSDDVDKMSYRCIVEAKAKAKDLYIRGMRGTGNQEMYHMFVTPKQMVDLKLDSDFLANVRNAGVRGSGNTLFAGSNSLMVDGVMIHEFRHVCNDSQQAVKWGSAAEHGAALFCGAQALAMADIGVADVVEESFDYGNQHGISIGKIFGLRKPIFNTDVSGTVEDFGVIRIDTAQ
tara:strand:+ start:4208 stop:5329 length:1122 start_codon:yes stop_codon:yes gene_type:complete